MEITVSARHMDLTEALKANVEEKFGNIHPFGLQLMRANITLEVEHGEHIAKAYVHGAKVDVEAIGRSDDMYESIHLALEKAEKQIEKRAGHLIKHK